ncbi:sterol carrier family protein [Streptomyces sp. LX-29]|uniref:sterol carrier family protein n=1 Tax=Streptomyces sp. LX-29 TaxID=2900152 RepID=UPI00240D17D6|nr:sterol carrier family protein [Streptomyces sp. LX-29]WFB08679.1 sterol carrier family protein [Streptomyces sp. LX-29]
MPPARRKPRARTYDDARTRAAVIAQLGHVREAVAGLTEAQLAAPAGPTGRTVRELAARLGASVEQLNRDLELPAPPAREVALDDWVAASAARGADVARGPETAAEGAEAGPAAGAAELGARLERATARLAALVADAPAGRLVPARAGAMRLEDVLVTRCVELVVDADDMAAATGVAVRHDRHALAAATRLLADALAAKAPGGSVEVRVPPYAVVQCVEGPRHTRGTPPNVVETAPLTWLRLATGRLTWADALESAEVTASGERADLAALLPLLV